MLELEERQLVKATAPVLQEHGVALTRHFYARMFSHNPELKEFFNRGHQQAGDQQQALAMAVAAYADNIDNPSVLLPVLQRIAHKHVSLGIRSEHYAIVGRHLLASIQEVLGDAVTPQLASAWAAAYQQLADLLIGMERSQYATQVAQTGGWSGWRSFRVARKHAESEEITSFELVPADGGAVPSYLPGQYVSVRLLLPQLGYRQPRQYSLSTAPGQGCLRISVKREAANDQRPEGMVSNHLHNAVGEGDVIELSPPTGEFFLHEDRDTPVVLISAGVGITPMMAMLEHLHAQQSKRQVLFLHACRHAGVQAFGSRLRERMAAMPNARAWVVHEEPREVAGATPADAIGRLDLSSMALPNDADCYVCGPREFMVVQMAALRSRGIPEARIHAEAFGTGGVVV